MNTAPLVWTLFALSASAHNAGLPVSGPGKSGVGDTPEALAVSETAGRHPNGTSAVTFSRTYNDVPETWTWRINVTDFAVPDRLDDLGTSEASFSEGFHVANTQWQLDWPGSDDSFQSFLAERNMTVSFTAYLSHKSSSVINAYVDGDNGNCSSILGDQCTQSLTESASKYPATIAGLAGCESTLNAETGDLESALGFVYAPASLNASNAVPSVLERDGSLFFQTSQEYPAGNTTLLNQTLSMLQVFVLRATYAAGVPVDTNGPTVLCRVVNKDVVVKTSASAVVSWRQSTAALWGMVVLSTLVIM